MANVKSRAPTQGRKNAPEKKYKHIPRGISPENFQHRLRAPPALSGRERRTRTEWAWSLAPKGLPRRTDTAMLTAALQLNTATLEALWKVCRCKLQGAAVLVLRGCKVRSQILHSLLPSLCLAVRLTLCIKDCTGRRLVCCCSGFARMEPRPPAAPRAEGAAKQKLKKLLLRYYPPGVFLNHIAGLCAWLHKYKKL